MCIDLEALKSLLYKQEDDQTDFQPNLKLFIRRLKLFNKDWKNLRKEL